MLSSPPEPGTQRDSGSEESCCCCCYCCCSPESAAELFCEQHPHFTVFADLTGYSWTQKDILRNAALTGECPRSSTQQGRHTVV
ncbi:hypothetical protein P7K49_005899 [Saguinus oedipus]|uniref:Uncharacterized protein n=1 Tax=Saguinus oedipus TaxID=9490 RepID=A0ABQ9W0V9_SAGOE|nr:hypothetical protein P7K49_005899 [Saguinus oedipus]